MIAKARASWPLIEVALEAVASIDRPIFDVALRDLAAADPVASVVTDADSGQTIIGATDGIHLTTGVETLLFVRIVLLNALGQLLAIGDLRRADSDAAALRG